MDHFRQALPELTDKKQVIFDLSAVPFIDSAGLGAIIGAIRRVRENGGEAVVCAPKRSVCRVMQIVGLNRIVAIVDNVTRGLEYPVVTRAPPSAGASSLCRLALEQASRGGSPRQRPAILPFDPEPPTGSLAVVSLLPPRGPLPHKSPHRDDD